MTIGARLMRHEVAPLDTEAGALDHGLSTLRPTVPYCLALLTVGTSIIHFAVAGMHFQEYWLFGVLMLVAAWLQLLWAAAVVFRPTPMLWWLGAMLNAGIIVVYLITRTVGDVIGPTPTAVEDVGFGDAACTVMEAVVVVGCAWLLFGKRDYAIGRHGLVATCAAVGTVTATILSISLVAGGPEMVVPMVTPSLAPASDRQGLQANVPLPDAVRFAGLHRTTRTSDLQSRGSVSVEAWGWTVTNSGAKPLQTFYADQLPKDGWTNVQGMTRMPAYGGALHLTACQSGQVLLVSTSETTLQMHDPTGRIDGSVTAPHGGAALLIEIVKSPAVVRSACPNS